MKVEIPSSNNESKLDSIVKIVHEEPGLVVSAIGIVSLIASIPVGVLEQNSSLGLGVGIAGMALARIGGKIYEVVEERKSKEDINIVYQKK